MEEIPKGLVTLIESMTEKIRKLEAYQKDDEAAFFKMMGQFLRSRAAFLALKSVVRELAEKQGLPPQDFEEVLIERQKYYLDEMLSNHQDDSPGVVAVMDDRGLEEIPTGDGLPPIPWPDDYRS